MTKDELCFCLTRFILEAKKKNGDPYPAETLYEIIIAIQLYLALNGREMKFLLDSEFTALRNTLDTQMKELAARGLRVRRKQAEIITITEEETMWKSVLGSDTPKKLVDTLIYLFGLNFALRACKEHRNLRCGPDSQIEVKVDVQGRRFLRYTEDVSKSCQGGLNHRRIVPKSVDAYENVENPDRCIVRLYEQYLSHRPDSPRCSDAMYLRPLIKPLGEIWYSCQPMGVHTISRTVSSLCKNAGLDGYHTNHSLRATAASRLYQKNFDEQLISETTGHRSNAVRRYKRTSDEQRKAISESLRADSGPHAKQYRPDDARDSSGMPKDVHLTVNVTIR